MTLLQDRLCAACNNELGKLDEELTRTGETAFYRSAFGIKGRPGHAAVKPTEYRAASATPPTQIWMSLPERDYKVLAEPIPNLPSQTPTLRPMRQLVFRRDDGTIACVPLPRGWTADIIRSALSSRQLEPRQLIEMYPDQGETRDNFEPQVRQMLLEVFGPMTILLAYGQGESVKTPIDLKFGFAPGYPRAIAKVAFHYFLWASTTCVGNEPEFDAVRRFIYSGDGSPNDFVDRAHPVFKSLFAPQPMHFLCSFMDDHHVVALVQFFAHQGTLEESPYVVRLGRRPAHIQSVSPVVGHQIRYYEEHRDRHDAEINTLNVNYQT